MVAGLNSDTGKDAESLHCEPLEPTGVPAVNPPSKKSLPSRPISGHPYAIGLTADAVFPKHLPRLVTEMRFCNAGLVVDLQKRCKDSTVA